MTLKWNQWNILFGIEKRDNSGLVGLLHGRDGNYQVVALVPLHTFAWDTHKEKMVARRIPVQLR